MAVVGVSSAYDTAHVINGRPDLDWYVNRRGERFGVTHAKKFPPYVFGVNANSGLVHKIAGVQLHWYRVCKGGSAVVKMNRPVMIAVTVCSQSWRLEGAKSRTCQVPKDDAILCGRCHGEIASFSKKKGGKFAHVPRTEAHVRLGCVVNGYGTSV